MLDFGVARPQTIVLLVGLPSFLAEVHDVRQFAQFAPDVRPVWLQTRRMLLKHVGRRDAVSLTELRRQCRQRLRCWFSRTGDRLCLEPPCLDRLVDPSRARRPVTLRY
jgi:hypothetical protein